MLVRYVCGYVSDPSEQTDITPVNHLGTSVIARSACDEAIQPYSRFWIASLRSRRLLCASGSHVHIRAQRIVLDEFAARLHHVAHQLGEDVVGLVDFLDLDLQQRALVGVQRGFP